MEAIFSFPASMAWSLAACLIQSAILVYLGIHVVARKVIFVDLALAQIAALGAVTGVMMGYEANQDPISIHLYSLAFTIFGAFILSLTKMQGERIPHEAVIGIVYAVAFAATLIVLAKSPLGPMEIDRILKGEILYVSGSTVLRAALVYALVGIAHFALRRRFLPLSFQPERAGNAELSARVWDFLFYLLFGVVVTSAVAIAGVFLVFSYLIIPAVGAMLVAERLWTRLLIGWLGASLISFIGVKLSWHMGLPTSPLIVCLLGAALIACALVRYLVLSARLKLAAFRMACVGGLVALFLGGLFAFRKPVEDPYEHALHMAEGGGPGERILGLTQLSRHPERRAAWIPVATELLSDPDREVRKQAAKVLGESGDASAPARVAALLTDAEPDVREVALKIVKAAGDASLAGTLIEAADAEQESDLKIEMLEAALELGSADAVDRLIALIRDEPESIFSHDAFEHLKAHLEFDFRVSEVRGLRRWWERTGREMHDLMARFENDGAPDEERARAYERLRELMEARDRATDIGVVETWWRRNRDRLTWDPGRKVFHAPAR